jgi:hypothetical protein
MPCNNYSSLKVLKLSLIGVSKISSINSLIIEKNLIAY